jgi:hypothetical protein
MDSLKLIYVNHVGTNWRDLNIYEFIFSDTTEDVEGDDWDVLPAINGNVTPPQIKHIKVVGTVETELELVVASKSDKYSIWDSVDGVIPLAYENIEDYEVYPETRLVLPFGVKLSDVTDAFLEKEIILDYKTIKDEED